MPAVPVPSTCANCAYWKQSPPAPNGVCQRYPVAVSTPPAYTCGEWLKLPMVPAASAVG